MEPLTILILTAIVDGRGLGQPKLRRWGIADAAGGLLAIALLITGTIEA